MPSDRPPIPQDVADRLLADNRHTCCICKIRRDVIIHHIDVDRSNNDPQNLAVLCVSCHSDVHSDQGFGRKFSQGEIQIYKNQWEERCKVEDTKRNVINNYFIFANENPKLNNSNFFKNFITDVASGMTQNDVVASVDTSAALVLNSTGDQELADAFKVFVLKKDDE